MYSLYVFQNINEHGHVGRTVTTARRRVPALSLHERITEIFKVYIDLLIIRTFS